MGLHLADTAGQIYPQFNRTVTLSSRYMKGTSYQVQASQFGLSNEGIYKLACGIALSRYVGIIEITTSNGELFDVVLDATEILPTPTQPLLVFVTVTL